MSANLGTPREPRHLEVFRHHEGSVQLRAEYFSYVSDLGLVAGTHLTVNFRLDAPRARAWRFIRDWNTWMNSSSYYFSRVIGDLNPGDTFRLSQDPADLD